MRISRRISSTCFSERRPWLLAREKIFWRRSERVSNKARDATWLPRRSRRGESSQVSPVKERGAELGPARSAPAIAPVPPVPANSPPAAAPPDGGPDQPKGSGSGDVVRLDRFRKK